MAKKQLRKDFLIAVEPGLDWYKAIPEHTAQRKQAEGHEVISLPNPLSHTMRIHADTQHGLLEKLIKHMPSLHNDLAEAVATHLLNTPGKIDNLIQTLQAAELEARRQNIDLDVEEKLYIEHGENQEKLDELEQDWNFMRSLPIHSFRQKDRLTVLSYQKRTTAIEKAKEIAEDPDLTRDQKLTAIRNELRFIFDGYNMVVLADRCGFDYKNTHANNATFNVIDSVMKHWDELPTTSTHKFYDAFVVGKGDGRQIFIQGETVKHAIGTPQP